MTPAARHQAAIEVLDRILAGTPAEPALTNWGRAHRFAGSGDRQAIRDLVFAALRCRRSFAALGGGMTGRGLVLGGLRAAGAEVGAVFSGAPHAPGPVGPGEAGRPPEGAEALDLPDWLLPRLEAALGPDLPAVARALQARAPVFLRVNLARLTREAAQARLAEEGIATAPHPLAETALVVTANERKVQASAAFAEGLVELQDASSQAVAGLVPLWKGARVLDYCAGGGGKTLALAARGSAPDAHDAAPHRMRDLPARADRAGARVRIVENPERTAPYDVILMDAPCSGSGSWRRDPQGKWALTEARLAELTGIQAAILDRCAGLLAEGGVLAYATCSLLAEENEAQAAAFCRRRGFALQAEHRFSPLQGGDGFYLAILTREGQHRRTT